MWGIKVEKETVRPTSERKDPRGGSCCFGPESTGRSQGQEQWCCERSKPRARHVGAPTPAPARFLTLPFSGSEMKVFLGSCSRFFSVLWSSRRCSIAIILSLSWGGTGLYRLRVWRLHGRVRFGRAPDCSRTLSRGDCPSVHTSLSELW